MKFDLDSYIELSARSDYDEASKDRFVVLSRQLAGMVAKELIPTHGIVVRRGDLGSSCEVILRVGKVRVHFTQGIIRGVLCRMGESIHLWEDLNDFSGLVELLRSLTSSSSVSRRPSRSSPCLLKTG